MDEMKLCYKGIEISANGEVHDGELRHGIFQLQYAMPSMLKDMIWCNAMGHVEDNLPLYFMPILLTTARIFRAYDEFSIENVCEADSLEHFAEEIPYPVCYKDSSPDFLKHWRKIFKDIDALRLSEQFQAIDRLRKVAGHGDPMRKISEIAEARCCRELYAPILVCNMQSFGTFLDEMLSFIKNETSSAQKIIIP